MTCDCSRELPPVSVVIPTFNRRAHLLRVLESTLADHRTAEAVVVVDGCHDGSLELARRLAARDRRVVPMFVENRGLNWARQLGAEKATGEVVLFLDDDVIPGPRLSEGHARHHIDRRPLLVLGYMPTVKPVHRTGRDVAAFIYGGTYERQCQEYDRSTSSILRNLWGGNFSMRKADALRLGVARRDVDLPRHGDRELGLRCLRYGMEAVFDRSLTARHEYSRPVEVFIDEAAVSAREFHQIHCMHNDLVGPFDPLERYGKRSAVRLASRLSGVRLIGRGQMHLLRTVSRVAGRCRLFGVQQGAVVVARTIVQQPGSARSLPAVG